jgi:hypothetical protein
MRITVPLNEACGDALRRLASQEFRDPRMQAKLILERELRRAGAAERTATDRPTETSAALTAVK